MCRLRRSNRQIRSIRIHHSSLQTVSYTHLDVYKRQVFAYTAKFDGAELTADTIEVTDAEIEEAYAQVDDTLLTVIRKAKDNIESYHAKQRQNSWFDSKPDGTILGQKITPLHRVGVYVPGGKAVYPLSLIHIWVLL